MSHVDTDDQLERLNDQLTLAEQEMAHAWEAAARQRRRARAAETQLAALEDAAARVTHAYAPTVAGSKYQGRWPDYRPQYESLRALAEEAKRAREFLQSTTKEGVTCQ